MDLTVSQVATLIGVDVSTLNRWLRRDEALLREERRFPGAYRPSERDVRGSPTLIPQTDVLAYLSRRGN